MITKMDADGDGEVSGQEVVQHVQKMEAELITAAEELNKTQDELKRTVDELDGLKTELEKLSNDKEELHAVYMAAEEEGTPLSSTFCSHSVTLEWFLVL